MLNRSISEFARAIARLVLLAALTPSTIAVSAVEEIECDYAIPRAWQQEHWRQNQARGRGGYWAVRRMLACVESPQWNFSDTRSRARELTANNADDPYGWASMAEVELIGHARGDRDSSLWNAYRYALRGVNAGPDVAEAHVTMGKVDLASGNLLGAAMHAARARKLGGETLDVLLLAGLIMEKVGRGDEAARLLAQAASKDALGVFRAAAYLELAEFSIRDRKYEEAEAAFQAASAARPEDAFPRVRHGAFLLKVRGDEERAREVFNASLRVRPTVIARRLLALSDYSHWARRHAGGIADAELQTLVQRSLLRPEEALLEAAASPALSHVVGALTRMRGIKIDFSLRDGQGNTALMLAAASGSVSAIRLLVARVRDPNLQNAAGERAVGHLARRGLLAELKLLRAQGALVSYSDGVGDTPLSLSVKGGHTTVVRFLIEQGVTLEGSERWNGAALAVRAAAIGNTATLKVLHEAGASVSAPDPFGATPLIAATVQGHVEVVRWLLKQGADTATQYQGNTALDFARDRGDGTLIRLLTEGARFST